MCVIYNHPRKSPAKFLEYLDLTAKKLAKENKNVILFGDFNLDLLKFEKVKTIESL